jgi:hypothetical protein
VEIASIEIKKIKWNYEHYGFSTTFIAFVINFHLDCGFDMKLCFKGFSVEYLGKNVTLNGRHLKHENIMITLSSRKSSLTFTL